MNVPKERCYYSSEIENFLTEDPHKIRGVLTDNSRPYDVSFLQQKAWDVEIKTLKDTLEQYSARGSVFLEYKIPRLGRRVDAVVLIDGVIFVLEFKVGAEEFLQADTNQTMDYALDLKHFHEGSHDRTIVPILVATDTERDCSCELSEPYDGKVLGPLFSNVEGLAGVIGMCLSKITEGPLNSEEWALSRYSPTPTIIQAARVLYELHNVNDISRSDAEAENLTKTSEKVSELIKITRENGQSGKKGNKAIFFVTGVPGAGKTLVGLDLTFKGDKDVIYLSGNDPLIRVLTDALSRDCLDRRKREAEEKARAKRQGGSGNVANEEEKKLTLKDAAREVSSRIQVVHRYRDESVVNKEAPADHVAIFDEAQRVWTQEKLAAFMEKKGVSGFPEYSEPEFLISYLNRHKDWAAIVCLIGGGQEIHDGEAGVAEWIRALDKKDENGQKFSDYWSVYVSPDLKEDLTKEEPAKEEFAKEVKKKPRKKSKAEEEIKLKASELLSLMPNVEYVKELNLSVSLRSPRGNNMSSFVDYLLDLKPDEANAEYEKLQSEDKENEKKRYPIYLTRSVETAKKWLKERTVPYQQRCGILASKFARRLKPLSINVRSRISVEKWFLASDDDVRSSNFLEDVATEFDVQGLEVDWACVVWDADFRYEDEDGKPHWGQYSFDGGTKWENINVEEIKTHQKNAYRVLLTRARQGMVIVVPEGDDKDATRQKEFYKKTYEYLRFSVNIEEI